MITTNPQPELFRVTQSQHGDATIKPNPIKAMVRAGDPSTSRKAAEKVLPMEQPRKNVVIDLFLRFGPMTHPDLVEAVHSLGFKWKESSIRGVCSRLVDAGFVVDSLERRDGFTVWRLAT